MHLISVTPAIYCFIAIDIWRVASCVIIIIIIIHARGYNHVCVCYVVLLMTLLVHGCNHVHVCCVDLLTTLLARGNKLRDAMIVSSLDVKDADAAVRFVYTDYCQQDIAGLYCCYLRYSLQTIGMFSKFVLLFVFGTHFKQ